MLEEVYRISPTIIERIIKEYPTVWSLYDTYQQLNSEAGESLIEDLEVKKKKKKKKKIDIIIYNNKIKFIKLIHKNINFN